MWLSIISWKTTQKTQTRFLCSRDDSAEPVPSTSSKLVNNRPPTQEGTQTSQESASTSEKAKIESGTVWNMLIAMECPKLKDPKCSGVIHKVCVIGSISTTQVQDWS